MAADVGTDSEGANSTWVDSGEPVDNDDDADDEGAVGVGRVDELVVDDEEAVAVGRVDEAVVNDEDDGQVDDDGQVNEVVVNDEAGADDEGMLWAGLLEDKVPKYVKNKRNNVTF